jgi:hypothetical protein
MSEPNEPEPGPDDVLDDVPGDDDRPETPLSRSEDSLTEAREAASRALDRPSDEDLDLSETDQPGGPG